ncbi:uncharacterized protein GGS22DRAFT_200318 [Annulohypoxylon maeteangense]|uniref:uncharacterized protein n=1 Tax=Annulohypoxylon maeteangense TaxID=1927788 RepID=UPI0020087FD6|nr:uncharacterized protein GGS22DRAFT_200318 [Annulohypoxylon maeteangense]KAI0884520.1 hypothetical protein GGS22DRAFT_200318 [Annulohypoxylon maeteangense]
MSTSQTPFPDLPNIGISFPHSPITLAALEYTKQHTTEATYNHCIRAAYWALILAKKLPNFSSLTSPSPTPSLSPKQPHPKELNIETVVLAAILHDMGWATTKELRSIDKRFEVDGANLAYAFIGQYVKERGQETGWDGHRRNIVWDAIALHCTPSIAVHHPSPEVALAHLGIMADFLGPKFPPGDGAVISVEEYKEVLAAFPMKGFGSEELKEIMCGICREKPDTTYDNFVGAFGARFGVDGKGAGAEEFKKEIERREPLGMLLGGLDYLEGLLKEGK